MPCILTFYLFVIFQSFGRPDDPRPNILWITSEDNGPFLGCYGDKYATTPHLDKMAEQGFRYTRAFANAPVCSPTRNTIITGLYACSGGNQNMRSEYNKSELVSFFPRFLREKGYYCTNNEKTDYNINKEQTRGIWDESGPRAHYKNRKSGQPFFAVFNSMLTHESSIHKPRSSSRLRHDPTKVTLPPYHPDTPEIRHDWAYYYDNVEDMDTWVGEILKDLGESGELDNTIIFYYSDHGGILTRSKRFLYDSGTRSPLLVHIPEKYKYLWPSEKPGEVVDRLVSYVDLAPTLLSITGTKIPGYMQGQAFLGEQKSSDPRYVFLFRDRQDERYDMSRGVRDARFKYIRNYFPYKPHGQYLETLWFMPTTRSWQKACESGNCNEVQQFFWKPKPAEELYDTEVDPWEVNNLAGKAEYRGKLEELRGACRTWMVAIMDTGIMPEAELISRTQSSSAYDYFRSGGIDYGKMVDAADFASASSEKDLPRLLDLLKSDEPVIRYWGASGLLGLGKGARPARSALRRMLNDPSVNVSVMAAEALYRLGYRGPAREAFIRALRSPEEAVRNTALNIIDLTNEHSLKTRNAVVAMVKSSPKLDRSKYDLRVAKTLMDKWGIDSKVKGINWPWSNSIFY